MLPKPEMRTSTDGVPDNADCQKSPAAPVASPALPVCIPCIKSLHYWQPQHHQQKLLEVDLPMQKLDVQGPRYVKTVDPTSIREIVDFPTRACQSAARTRGAVSSFTADCQSRKALRAKRSAS